MDRDCMGVRILPCKAAKALAGITAADVHEISTLHYENVTKNLEVFLFPPQQGCRTSLLRAAAPGPACIRVGGFVDRGWNSHWLRYMLT